MAINTHYTVSGFAKAVGVNRSTLYKWKEKGILVPRINFKGSPYYNEDDYQQVMYGNQCLTEEDFGVTVVPKHIDSEY